MKVAFRLLAVALGSLTACVHTTDVPGPDGETAHLISCRSTDDCYEKAGELCPEGYVLRTSSRTSNDHGQILVSCKSDLSVAQAAAVPPSERREDSLVCDAAYKYEQDFADYWVARTAGAKRLNDLPDSRDFVGTCKQMPEPVQRCLHEHFREAHDEACEALLSRLDPAARAKVDGMFLQATTTPPAPTTAPGTVAPAPIAPPGSAAPAAPSARPAQGGPASSLSPTH